MGANERTGVLLSSCRSFCRPCPVEALIVYDKIAACPLKRRAVVAKKKQKHLELHLYACISRGRKYLLNNGFDERQVRIHH